MFAPPPAPALSRAEIEARRAKLQAEIERQKAASSAASATVQSDSSSEHRSLTESTEALSKIRKIGIFGIGKDDKKAKPAIEISAPILSSSAARTVEPAGSPLDQQLHDFLRAFPPPPAPPPAPPGSPLRQGDGQLTPVSGQSSPMSFSGRSSPLSPPPRRPPRPASNLSFESALLSPALHRPPRASTEGPGSPLSLLSQARDSGLSVATSLIQRTGSDRSARSIASSASSQALHVQKGRIDKALKRGSGGSSNSEETSNAVKKFIKPNKARSRSNTTSRRQNTSSLEAALLGLGGVPEQSRRGGNGLSIKPIPYGARRSDGSLTDSLGSIARTPPELYSARALPETPNKAPQTRTLPGRIAPELIALASTVSPRRLAAIPEHLTTKESPTNSGVSTPLQRQIHLRGGSVVTVTSPELDAWRRSVYLQGPIRLTKPTILPRKNSLASLEPFQEALDQVYQEDSRNSRRVSDEAAVRDICAFFLDFGTCDVYAPADQEIDNVAGSEEEEWDSEDCLGVADSPNLRAILPPIVPEILVLPDLPPVETEETLRARGIARLLKKAAAAQTEADAAPADARLTLVPMPEVSILDAVLASADQYGNREKSHVVAELTLEGRVDSSAPWVSSGNKDRAAGALKRYSA